MQQWSRLALGLYPDNDAMSWRQSLQDNRKLYIITK